MRQQWPPRRPDSDYVREAVRIARADHARMNAGRRRARELLSADPVLAKAWPRYAPRASE
ncbi:hypothetical protein DIE07_05950 [Burkholderia sp. Bp9002]|nr:hypothetical protein DIE18_09295 [Burkholderia sp. Bp9125]RQS13709.1 hypothetical protein DIE07_05950 [Burkholderia sp. Bp9002]